MLFIPRALERKVGYRTDAHAVRLGWQEGTDRAGNTPSLTSAAATVLVLYSKGRIWAQGCGTLLDPALLAG